MVQNWERTASRVYIVTLLISLIQAGIKVAGRNINVRYADDTTVMAESKEELKSLLMKVKKEIETAS